MAVTGEVYDVTVNLVDGEKVTLKFRKEAELNGFHETLGAGRPFTTLIGDEMVSIFPGGITTVKVRIRATRVSH
jgi:hypothetical protein